MKAIILFLILLITPGCWRFLSEPVIICWYVGPANEGIGGMWYAIEGHTDKYHDEVSGPIFRTIEEANKFIADHNLKICGTR